MVADEFFERCALLILVCFTAVGTGVLNIVLDALQFGFAARIRKRCMFIKHGDTATDIRNIIRS